ncbi:sulfatase [Algoriphagus namhaensis]|uniref:Sulfatase n=1 Tax=Algoriphagus namhaensis TaxID=915353 RepID=A0ABV8ATL2_9BACT
MILRALILFFLLAQIPFAQAQQKPNLIFILTDDQRWDALGFAGNEIIQTPEMDRLAREGVYFENAFVTTPICAASRASILTGLYERTHGYTFGQEFQERFAQSSYPTLLREAGYNTAFFGKFGINYPGFGNLFDTGDSYDRNGKFDDRRGYFYKTIGEDTVHLTKYTSYQVQEFIKAQPSDQPFALSLSFSAPHAHDPSKEQYFWSEDVDALYAEVTFPDPLLKEEKYFLDQPEYVRTGENRTRWYWRFETPEKYQQSMKGYYRMISEVDREIGRIRKVLEEKRLADNTVIIVMGDNGYFQGERQMAGKWLMYENSLRVPLIIYDPRNPRQRTVSDFALNIDIAPTLVDLAGVRVPKSMQGLSLVSSDLGSRKDFIAEHLWQVKIIPPSEGIRTEKWKYFRYINDPSHEELYDLLADPLEMNNLATDPAYKKQLKSLRKKFEKRAGLISRSSPQ